MTDAGLFYSSHTIGNYTNEAEMFVRRYGMGKDNNRAIFLIGRLHGNEEGAMVSIDIMENYIKKHPSVVPENTSVFVLNPANNNPEDRDILGKDPNRNFLDKDVMSLNETRAIALFTKKIAKQWKNFTIISAHHYNDIDGQRRTRGIGWVFPLYELTPDGIKATKKTFDDGKVMMKKNIDYIIPKTSDVLAKKFSRFAGFQYEPMWLYDSKKKEAEMYPGEFMHFISRLKSNSSIRMIEYEIPKSRRKISNRNIRKGLIDFIVFLLAAN